MGEATAASRAKPWLLSRSGLLAGTRFPMPDGVARIGRAPDNDIVVSGPDAATVSLYHAQIVGDGGSWHLHDLGSTNGTWLNGERITEAEVGSSAIIRLGNQGPEFELIWDEGGSGSLDRTVELSASMLDPPPSPPPPSDETHESLLAVAVARARRMRAHGLDGQTMHIMRGVLEEALRNSRRRLRVVGYSLLLALVLVAGVGIWMIAQMKREKGAIDAKIHRLETELQKTTAQAETGRLLSQLNDYQGQAELLQRNLLYRIGGAYGTNSSEDFVTRELRALMAEFGAESYSIPPDFLDRVNHYIEQDQGPEHPLIARALGEAGGQIRTMRQILTEERLPADLAYIPIVESALVSDRSSAAGAAGPWQFTAASARALGLRVDAQIDERKDLIKSTRASCKYLRDLILDFGAGSSVMLALAAYNSGAGKVKQAVVRNVRDPIQQRNFWYLYRTRALPDETREYVPKVFAAMLIGRNPKHFGF